LVPCCNTLCIQLVGKGKCNKYDKPRQSRSQALAVSLESPTWLQQTSILRPPTDERLSVVQMRRRELSFVGKGKVESCMALPNICAEPLTVCTRQLRIIFQPCDGHNHFGLYFSSRGTNTQVGITLACSSFIYYNCQHGVGVKKPSICFSWFSMGFLHVNHLNALDASCNAIVPQPAFYR
jgi:hypothetical protein